MSYKLYEIEQIYIMLQLYAIWGPKESNSKLSTVSMKHGQKLIFIEKEMFN